MRALPEEIDLSIISTMAALGAVIFTVFGGVRGYQAERIRRLALGGTLTGAIIGVVIFIVALVGQLT